MRLLAGLIATAAVVAVGLPATAGSVPSPDFKPVLSGKTGDAVWTLGMKREKVGRNKGICIEVDVSFADGFGGRSLECAAGSLSLAGNVLPSGLQLGAGGVPVAHVVAGIVPDTARRVVVVFADGKKVRLTPRRPPRTFRKALGTTIRVYGGDALAAPNPKLRRVVAFDRKGKRVARSKSP